jgi:NAD+ kinase
VSKPARVASVFTHRRPGETGPALARLLAAAENCEAELRFDETETEKHGLSARGCVHVSVSSEQLDEVDLCFALGGDGTILTALRRYAGTGIPVYGVNFGEVGFLATIDPGEVDDGFASAFRGEYEVLELPAIGVSDPDRRAINDISLHRRPGGRVAQLAYMLGGDEIGRVRCDGLVVATPAGSTGYNLANGGPVLAWGVEGYVVSFIAPHSLTARALVVAPDDVLTLRNVAREDDAVDLSVDGRPDRTLAAGESIELRLLRGAARLAQEPGSTFYRRLRERFGRLAV